MEMFGIVNVRECIPLSFPQKTVADNFGRFNSEKVTDFKPLPVWVADNKQQMYQRIDSLPRR